jgi:hypothetical protein
MNPKIILLTLLLTACTALPTPTPTHPPPTPPPKPPYLLSIVPEGRKTKELYDKSLSSNFLMERGIVVKILDRGDLCIADELREIGIKSQRVALFIDSQQVDHRLFTFADGLMPEGPFWLSWSPNLDLGLHEARFQITTHLGEVLEYSWQFIIGE